jgi:hypothetical protein
MIKRVSKLSRPMGPIWRGGEITKEPGLPFSTVHYPQNQGIYLAFSRTSETEPYLCLCGRRIIQIHARELGYETELDFVVHGNGQNEGAIKRNLLPKALIERARQLENVEMLYRENLCHACNQVIPAMMSSAYPHASFCYAWVYWYVRQTRLGYGFIETIETSKKFFQANPERFAISMSKAKDELDSYRRCRRQFWNETEMETKTKFGLHAIGGSSQAEHLILGMVKSLFSDQIVQQKVKPKWLMGLELDIWIPHLQLGIEYQGEQHYKPIEHWGGQESFDALVERDRRKRKLCKENAVHLLEIKYSEPLDIEVLIKKLEKTISN